MFGEGATHGSPVSSKCMPPCQPSISTTVRSAGVPAASATNSALNSRASSPTVMPWRWAIGLSPTNVACSGCRTGPAASAPETGLGRSRTTNLMPSPAAASIARYIVQM